MKRRFIIPALCALLFHAALLLGSRPVEKTTVNKDAGEIACLVPATTILDEPIEVSIWDPDVTERNEDLRKGETDAANPSSEDRSRFTDERTDFTMINEPVVHTERKETNVINPGAVGVPHGVPDGFKLTGGIFDTSKLDRVPQALSQIPPRYPAEPRMKGLSGEVVVEFAVNEAGNVSSCRVVRSTSREFEPAALAAVSKWRFEPGRRHGHIVRFSMVVPVVFRLND